MNETQNEEEDPEPHAIIIELRSVMAKHKKDLHCLHFSFQDILLPLELELERSESISLKSVP